ncbi:hypothetical protein EB796_017679 [Bugula neritina]|uniref:Uncharacterized protein n=1 Tax=Bugula neritina TaxID=10212 RepID=A0A7J7JCV3_BUGNE|nr:hypothetical protein EB796_017679 [Bugula neritina]
MNSVQAVNTMAPANENIFYSSYCILPSSAIPHLTSLLQRTKVKQLRLPRFGFHPPEPLLKAIFDLNSLYVLSLDTVLAGAAQEEGSSWLSPQHLKRILNLPNLTSLHLAGGISSDDEFSLDSIATSPSLAHLSLQQFSAPHILKIVEVMAFTNPDALRRLDLKVAASQSGMMSEDEKTVDTELTGVLKRCTKVEELKLSYSRLDVDSCEAEYLKDTLSMTFPQTAVSVNLYD